MVIIRLWCETAQRKRQITYRKRAIEPDTIPAETIAGERVRWDPLSRRMAALFAACVRHSTRVISGECMFKLFVFLSPRRRCTSASQHGRTLSNKSLRKVCPPAKRQLCIVLRACFRTDSRPLSDAMPCIYPAGMHAKRECVTRSAGALVSLVRDPPGCRAEPMRVMYTC